MFTVPADDDLHPVRFYERLVETCEEHDHLRTNEPTVGFLIRDVEKVRQGRRILGSVHMPRVNGDLGPVFDWMLENLLGFVPDFLMILEGDYWRAGTDRDREILMFHEMCRMVQAVDQWGCPRFHRESGEPIWALQGHDVEEFNKVVARYGSYSDDITRFVAAVREGDAR